MTTLLLYTAKAERDVLGHAISFLEHGTFTHSALYRDGIMVEAVFPKVRRRIGQDAQTTMAAASEAIDLQPYSPEIDAAVWITLIQAMIGKPYSLSTLLADAAGNLLGQRAVARLGGSVVCSALCADYCRLVGDPRVPVWTDPSTVTPADLGMMFLGRSARP